MRRLSFSAFNHDVSIGCNDVGPLRVERDVGIVCRKLPPCESSASSPASHRQFSASSTLFWTHPSAEAMRLCVVNSGFQRLGKRYVRARENVRLNRPSASFIAYVTDHSLLVSRRLKPAARPSNPRVQNNFPASRIAPSRRARWGFRSGRLPRDRSLRSLQIFSLLGSSALLRPFACGCGWKRAP